MSGTVCAPSDLLGPTLPALRDSGLLPRDLVAVFVGGSHARGWQNPGSDVDVYVVSAEPWAGRTDDVEAVDLEPPRIAMAGLDVEGIGHDIEFWTQGQVQGVLAKVSADEVGAGRTTVAGLSKEEHFLLERLPVAIPLEGDGWLVRHRELLAASGYRDLLVRRAFDLADDMAEDALGQLAVGDATSAVLSARTALGHAVDGLLASHGEYGRSPKWRARRFQAAAPAAVGFPEYWRLETMRSYSAEAPELWVEEVIGLCRTITARVEV